MATPAAPSSPLLDMAPPCTAPPAALQPSTGPCAVASVHSFASPSVEKEAVDTSGQGGVAPSAPCTPGGGMATLATPNSPPLDMATPATPSSPLLDMATPATPDSPVPDSTTLPSLR
ncbi:hypothetical protein ON010_g17479 [Phytophthora cinnamomi]|nr:hypothetical protein ON010_g17479 [Phytophthora cinnamomi]